MKARAWISMTAILLAGVSAQVAGVVVAPPASAGCALAVNSLDHTIGFTAGGSSLTINGCGFSGSGTLGVTFGSTAGTSVHEVSDSQLTVTTPSHSTGPVGVTVSLGSSSATLTNGFTYVAAPTVTSIIPTSGPEAGGTAVHVTGTDLQPSGSTTSVYFGSNQSSSVTNLTNTTLVASAPAGTGTQDVTVKVNLPDDTANGVSQTSATNSSDHFTYVPAPTVTGISPATGGPLGGTDVVITGTHFQSGAHVLFGSADGSTPSDLTNDAAATPVSVVNSTTIDATTPAGAPGATNVVVVNPDGQSGALKSSAAGHYAYSGSAPTIASTSGVSPSSGTSLGGTVLTITGTGFLPGAGVGLKGGSDTNPVAATGVSVNAAGTQITATTPAHASGAVDVIVTNVGGGTVTDAGGYTYNAASAPTVSSLGTSTGTSLGGTTVSITGSNFASGATVTFGGTRAASAAVLNPTTITATTPGHAGSTTAVDVVVTNPDGQSATDSAAFTFVTATGPSISGVSPGTGDGGTEITISGSGFANTNGSSANAVSPALVQIGTATCVPGSTSTDTTCLQPLPATGTPPTSPPIVVSSTSIQGLVPDAPGGTVTVTVTNPDGQTATSSFQYTGPTGSPTITGVSPSTESTTLGGATVTVTGTNFVTGAVVRFGNCASGQSEPCGTPAPSGTTSVASGGGSITTQTPAGIYGTVDVTVTNPGGASVTKSDAITFTASPQPTITSVSPDHGADGTLVTITGTGFANTYNNTTTNAASPALVTIGGQPLVQQEQVNTPPAAPTFLPVVRSSTQIIGDVPSLPAGTYDVAVMNPDGQGAIDLGSYTVPSDTTAPTITATGTVGSSSYTFGNWANGIVNVALAATDSGSGVQSITYSASGAQSIVQTTVQQANVSIPVSAQGTTTITYWATDNAGNSSSHTTTAVVKVDTVAPTLASAATIPFGAGTETYTSGQPTNENVTVAFTCSDASGGSGVNTVTMGSTASTTTVTSGNPLDVTVTSAGDNQSISATCTDNAGNSTTATFSGIDIDKTAPVITASATTAGLPYTAGTWTDKAVTVTFTCTPTGVSNQIATLTAPIQVAGPVTNGTEGGTCIDAAGNSATTTFGTGSAGIDIDLTLPIATATATLQGTTTPYVAGTWTNKNVVVTFHCTDTGTNQSGVNTGTVTAPVTVSTPGSTSGVVGGCTDNAGNTANPPAFFGPILIDKTPPTCTVSVNPISLSPANTKMVSVTVLVGVSDAQSGPNGFQLLSVTDSNPATASTDISGFVPNTPSTAGQLRATKGRVYTLTYKAFDATGNFATCGATVTVRS